LTEATFAGHIDYLGRGRGARDGKTNGAKVIRHKLTERVNDTYENWRTDPRYQQWRTENRFDFLAIR
jgi:hypothetical protein